MKLVLYLSLIIALSGCIEDSSKATTVTVPALSKADSVINNAILAHGGENFNPSHIQFDFRDKHFDITYAGGEYSFTRIYSNDEGVAVSETLNNEGITALHNNNQLQLLTREAQKIVREQINSVVYFALVPYRLNDEAVQKKHLGETIVRDEKYNQIEVTFSAENGGPDFEDRYVYWIHQTHHTVDYLAYDYHTNETGTRFREAVNVRTVNGIRFADYINYKSDLKVGDPIETYGALLENNAVTQVSEINLENIAVE